MKLKKIDEAEPPIELPNTRTLVEISFIGVQEIHLNGNIYLIVDFTLPVVTWIEEIEPKLLVSRYLDLSIPDRITYIGSCEVHLVNEPFKVLVIGAENIHEPGSRKIRFQFLTLDDHPYYGMGGGRIEIWGQEVSSLESLDSDENDNDLHKLLRG